MAEALNERKWIEYRRFARGWVSIHQIFT